MGFLVHTLARRKDNTMFAFIVRESDGAVYHNTDQEFIPELKLHLVLDELSRSQLRVPYVETRAGSYRLEVDCTNFLDSDYTLQSRFLTDGQESSPTDVVSVNATVELSPVKYCIPPDCNCITSSV